MPLDRLPPDPASPAAAPVCTARARSTSPAAGRGRGRTKDGGARHGASSTWAARPTSNAATALIGAPRRLFRREAAPRDSGRRGLDHVGSAALWSVDGLHLARLGVLEWSTAQHCPAFVTIQRQVTSRIPFHDKVKLTIKYGKICVKNDQTSISCIFVQLIKTISKVIAENTLLQP